MKKLTILTAIGLFSCLTSNSFGQGYLTFNDSATTAVYDNFTSVGTPVKSPANILVGILWNSTAGQTIPALGNTATGANTPVSWAALTAVGWNFATNASSTLLTAITRAPAPTTGTFSGGVQGIQGTSPNQTISMYVIGWQSTYANPFAARDAGSALGWSNPFNELLGADSAPGVSMNAAGMTQFNVNATIPEPGTFALAGLGAAAMFIFRRRK